ncbi:hypothetical protein J2Z32_000314 [Paenibacillus turicensis]|uniref:Uncharacterized protein n=1 Tax=Paenibacillus turicensis TaxID=160487 RepID=A0ABS4FM94_9BACL|nr:hypothetical protein [Paenibacillus turicensis]MBP1903702.1 hypothetical protein [Paenibacillus turicensis]
MFKIDYRIVDDFNELRAVTYKEFNEDFTDIFGFFSVNYNGIIEGYYHDNKLRKDENGQDMLVSWFDLFLSVLENFNNSNYVAFREVGTLDIWYEFQYKQDEIYISRTQGIVEKEYIIFEKHENFKSSVWSGVKIPFNDFRNEIMLKVKDFILQIELINNQLIKADILNNLILKMKRVEELNY